MVSISCRPGFTWMCCLLLLASLLHLDALSQAHHQLENGELSVIDSQIIQLLEDEPLEAYSRAIKFLEIAEQDVNELAIGRGYFLKGEAEYYIDSFTQALSSYYESRKWYERHLPASASQIASTYAK